MNGVACYDPLHKLSALVLFALRKPTSRKVLNVL